MYSEKHKEAFQNHEFSKSWEEFESKYYKEAEIETEEIPNKKEGAKKKK